MVYLLSLSQPKAQRPALRPSRVLACDNLVARYGLTRSTPRKQEASMPEKRGVSIHFNDGSKVTLDFPKQSANEAAAQMKLEDVLKKRYVMFEADGALYLVPFENVKYIQLHPAPEKVPGHTYIKEATVV
jgi:hypothetical protein